MCDLDIFPYSAEIHCESSNHTGISDNVSFTDEFSSTSVLTQSATSGTIAVETTSASTETVSLSGYSVVFSTTTEEPKYSELLEISQSLDMLLLPLK